MIYPTISTYLSPMGTGRTTGFFGLLEPPLAWPGPAAGGPSAPLSPGVIRAAGNDQGSLGIAECLTLCWVLETRKAELRLLP